MDSERQALDVGEERGAQIEGDFLAGAFERVQPPVREQSIQKRDQHDQHADDSQKHAWLQAHAKGRRSTAQECVEHHFEWPRLGEIDERGAERPECGQGQTRPARTQVGQQVGRARG